MKTKTLRQFLFSGIIGLLATFAVSAGEVIVPVGETAFDFEYDLTYREIISAGDLSLLSPVGPFQYHQMTGSNRPVMKLLGRAPDNHLKLLGLTNLRSQIYDGGKADKFYSLGGGIRYSLSETFGVLGLFNLDREKALDPEYTGQKWRGLAGGVETAAIYFTKPSVSISLGRQRVFWGPQPVNLALSATAAPLDLFSLRYHRGRLDFNFIFARLDQSRPDSLDYVRFPESNFNENRYLAGHRLDLRLMKNLRIGLYELTLFGGEGRSPELYYLNPLQLFHVIQLNEQIDDNTALGLDLAYIPKPGYFMYAQLLVDDFQIDNEAQGDKEPNEIGLMAGLIKTGKTASWSPDIKAEYVRITNRTYHQRRPRNRFLNRNQLLGHPLGPDADSISLSLRWYPSTRQSITFEGAFRRHGEGSIHNSWDEPWQLVTGDYSEPFPTGVVEKASFLKIGLEGYPPVNGYLAEHLFFKIEFIYGQYSNSGNVKGLSESRAWVGFSLTWLGGGSVNLND